MVLHAQLSKRTQEPPWVVLDTVVTMNPFEGTSKNKVPSVTCTNQASTLLSSRRLYAGESTIALFRGDESTYRIPFYLHCPACKRRITWEKYPSESRYQETGRRRLFHVGLFLCEQQWYDGFAKFVTVTMSCCIAPCCGGPLLL